MFATRFDGRSMLSLAHGEFRVTLRLVGAYSKILAPYREASEMNGPDSIMNVVLHVLTHT